MANLPSLLNPEDYINEYQRRQLSNELDIATEIFLAEKCTKIHYKDLMDDIPANLASKETLLGWLNESNRQGTVIRLGVIDLYTMEMKEHFEDGKWRPLHFGQFVEYALKKLIDPDFVNGRAKAELFTNSIRDMDWLMKASAVMGLKLLERLYNQRALKSTVASAIMALNFNNREFLEKNNRSMGKIAKQGGIDQQVTTEIMRNFDSFFKKQWSLSIERFNQHEEYKYFDIHKQAIERAILDIPKKLQLTISSNLETTIHQIEGSYSK